MKKQLITFLLLATRIIGTGFDSSAHPGARASRPLLMRTGTSALLYETRNDS